MVSNVTLLKKKGLWSLPDTFLYNSSEPCEPVLNTEIDTVTMGVIDTMFHYGNHFNTCIYSMTWYCIYTQ